MHLQDSIKRFFQYAKRHGFQATVGRIGLSFKRAWTGNWHTIFYYDFVTFKLAALDSPNHAKVERKNAARELDGQDLSQITNVWNPRVARRQIVERFEQGASLWLFKSNGKLAACGWTIVGRTIEPYFIPLGTNDAHLFDFFVFPEYRGQRINPSLVNHILVKLASEMRSRAFIEAAQWNAAQLSSLSKTPFRPFGLASKYNIFGKRLVIWSRKELKQRQ